MNLVFTLSLGLIVSFNFLKSDDDRSPTRDCSSDQVLDMSRGDCKETPTETSQYKEVISGTDRIIYSNSIPNHKTGLFGRVRGALNPNAISPQNKKYTIPTTPTLAISLIPLLSHRGPVFSFGVLLNGVELDPVAAEPFPHKGIMDPNVNWAWNLEATNVRIGLDCNNAHVQPTGKYHYHGPPTL